MKGYTINEDHFETFKRIKVFINSMDEYHFVIFVFLFDFWIMEISREYQLKFLHSWVFSTLFFQFHLYLHQ